MGCGDSKEQIDKFSLHYGGFNHCQSLEDTGNVINQKKGGLVVQTSIGNVQFGLPPETVKDSQNGGLTVPSIYIIPSHRFDKEKAVSVAEFEFPAYFNFFVLRKKIQLVADEKTEKACRTIFQETLQGPKDLSSFNDEFSHEYDPECIPDMRKELMHFEKNPFNPTENLSFDSLIQIIPYNKSNIADQSDGVKVKREHGYIHIIDGGEKLAKFRDKVVIDAANYNTCIAFSKEHLEKTNLNDLDQNKKTDLSNQQSIETPRKFFLLKQKLGSIRQILELLFQELGMALTLVGQLLGILYGSMAEGSWQTRHHSVQLL